MSTMKTGEIPPAIDPADVAALERTIQDMIWGVRDPRKMDEAAREMDEGREEIRRRIGETDIAAELTDPDDDEDE